ncbi:TetR/AcrR family transcriptional regulator [Nocardia sp. CA-151230]|uniref:TetR/AcrR family transcriptional regulator n=1 Tax=Nocardia sp. CA-151230 TaxID=3239982 RepID=UPI003D9113C6
MRERGPYTKGIERREQILDAALRTIAECGFLSTSVAELADAVGLTPSGLLHYFGSKEDLFLAVLRRRSQLDLASVGLDPASVGLETNPDPNYIAVIENSTTVPGLTELFTHMQAAAADHRHPAHAYMVEHYEQSSAIVTGVLQRMQDNGILSATADIGSLATQAIALMDGLQSRWLIDPTIDMAAELERFWQIAIKGA